MIIGIGTDIVEIERIKKACERDAFFVRCFTEEERQMIGNNWSKAAGNFAVKEGVAKAFGTGVRGFELQEVEVLRDKLGKPYVNLYGKAEEKRRQLGGDRFHVSISNTKEHAVSMVILESLREVT